MSAAYISGSGGDRAKACPPAYALDRGADEKGTDATNGTNTHAFLERIQSMSRDAALDLAPDEVADVCAAIDVDGIPRGNPEIAYVYDVATDTARCLGHIEHRRYPVLSPTEIPCTVDLVEAPAHVIDWKTGWESVPSAAESMQLHLGMLCVARVVGSDEAIGSIVRIGGDGQLHWDTVTADAFALEDYAAEWRAVLGGVARARAELLAGKAPSVSPGEHCRYCPARANCPAFAGVARELLAPGSDWLARIRTALEDDHGAADAWQKLAVAESLLRTVRGLIESRAIERPFTLPDGSMVREVVGKRDKIASVEGARKALLDVYGPAAETAFTLERHTTKGEIEKLAKAQAAKGKGAEETRRIFAVLREHKALVEGETRSVQAVKP